MTMKTKQNGIKQMKESKKDNKYKQSIRCIKYEVKLLKKQMKQGITENSILSAVEEQAVEAPREYSEDIDSLKNSYNELEEALRCLKHEMKQLKSSTPEPIVSSPFEQTPIDNSSDIDSLKNSVNELEEALKCIKYEMRQVKQNNSSTITNEYSTEEFDLQNNLIINHILHDIDCLKYEIRKIKSNHQEIKEPNENYLEKDIQKIK